MRFDLKTPCKHCPFRNDSRRITFACRERAEEIEEIAYREGFVCHQHGEMTEGFDGGEFIEFKEDGSSQHCAVMRTFRISDRENYGHEYKHRRRKKMMEREPELRPRDEGDFIGTIDIRIGPTVRRYFLRLRKHLAPFTRQLV